MPTMGACCAPSTSYGTNTTSCAASATPVRPAGDEILDCINYLSDAGYIELRHIETKQPVLSGLADYDYKMLEAKLTAKGISLLAYGIKDTLVEV